MKDPFDQDTHDFVGGLPPRAEPAEPAYPESFKDYPESLTHRKAEKAEDCSIWTPRDALLDVLRDIDSGKISPVSLVVAFSEHRDTTTHTRTGYRQAGPSSAMNIGTMEVAKAKILAGILG